MKTLTPMLAGLLLFVAACSPMDIEDIDDLTRNMQRWDARRPEMYEFVVQRSCECLYTTPLRVTVQGAEVVSVYDVAGDSIVTRDLPQATTVSGLFDIVRNALRDADDVSVTYDPEYGYPQRIDVTYYPVGLDDAFVIAAHDFHPVSLDQVQ